ncbi:MAG: NAD(P)H-dependent glycerol-3-phosphate dehydrogenase [candidate division WOR-3 bacterium]
MKIGILGCGNWGSVFGIIQHNNGNEVKIWEYDRERAEQVEATRSNEPFLKGHKIPAGIHITSDIDNVLSGTDLTVFAIPSQVLGSVVKSIREHTLVSKYYLSLTKGIEIATLRRPSEIIGELEAAKNRTYVLSGPCIANEIIRNEPTAVVLVGPDQAAAQELQGRLSTENFRIYQGDDIVGVELGAAIKNVIAIGCGISDGLGFGTNTKGALITRAVIEMQRIGVKMGARARTFWGLSGFGDLVTTAFSEESRNHILGKKVGKGKTLEQARREMIMVAVGAPTAKAIKIIAEQHRIDMPICDAVHSILYHEEAPKKAIRDLMSRPLRIE